ncbi:hypothetical protein O181_069925 [Austropuccinia psidii MF-1]|uniref:Uncharacterized protein n=1 Tax=Austropuccinia psidii MF-1 TaxID=1389203 RepID=A0A9Q3F3U6_9BASI|nr:hypothetical protein [Austropuccinia psidii MF-1]
MLSECQRRCQFPEGRHPITRSGYKYLAPLRRRLPSHTHPSLTDRILVRDRLKIRYPLQTVISQIHLRKRKCLPVVAPTSSSPTEACALALVNLAPPETWVLAAVTRRLAAVALRQFYLWTPLTVAFACKTITHALALTVYAIATTWLALAALSLTSIT